MWTSAAEALPLLAIALLPPLLYLWLWRPLGHWRRRGVPSEPALPLVGNYLHALLQTRALGEILRDIYRKHRGRQYVGVFQFGEPALMVCDPELLRAVMVKDFQHFRDNQFPVDPQLDPLLARNPFVLKGDEWKAVRAQLTPAFTSGKLRAVLPLVQAVCAQLVEYVRTEGAAAGPAGLDGKELAARYTTEVVSSVAFGLQANCFSDPDAEVRRMNRQILEPGLWRSVQLMLALFLPRLASLLRVRMMPREVDRFFRRLVRDAVEHRDRTGLERPDYLQMLMQLRNKHQATGREYGLEDVTAHALTFFVDGFETSSVALSFLLHDLASSPAEQSRLRAELAALDSADPEAPLHAPFLDACLQEEANLCAETLRLHPPATFLRKVCTEAYPLPGGGGAALQRGESLLVPLLALHTDPDLHAQPERWRPQRWLPENGGPPARFTCLPFGEGPRQCLGMRFALAQVKLGAAALLASFQVNLTPRSPPNPPPLDPTSFLYAAKGGLWLRFEPLGDACAQ